MLKCKVEVGEMQIKNLMAKFGQLEKKGKPIKSLNRLDSFAKNRQKESQKRLEERKTKKEAK
jgi:hypothetical protein